MIKEQKVQFSFAYLDVSVDVLSFFSSTFLFWGEEENRAASAVLFSLQGLLGYST